MKIKKIALIYAGGTIGMQPKNGELAPPKNEKDFEKACKTVTDEFTNQYGISVDFKYFDKKDSTERIPDDWQKIFQTIQSLSEKHLAVVIAHGTDTLANTASAISFAFSHPDHPQESSQSFPVVFTASQQPIYYNGGDGKFNLYHALEAALKMSERKTYKVAISFWDSLLLGNRALKNHDKRYNAFFSPAAPFLGQITSEGVELSLYSQTLKLNSDISSPFFSEGISTLEISPSTPKGIIKLLAETGKTRVLIIKTLGEGNIPNRLIPEIEEQSKKGKIIVLTSPFAGGSVGRSVYELGAKAIRAGAIPARDMVPPAVDAKCSWLIANGVTDRQEFSKKLQTNYVGEISVKNSLKGKSS